MSSPRLNGSQYMAKITEEELLKRFPQAFIEDPALTPDKFYEILCSVKFDIKKTQLKVIELVRKPGEYILPAKLLEDPLAPTPPTPSPIQLHTQARDGTSLFNSSTPLPGIEILSATTQLSPHSKTNAKIKAITDIADAEEELTTTKRWTSKRQAPIEISDDENPMLGLRSKKAKIESSSTSGILSPAKATSTLGSRPRELHGFVVDTSSDDDELPPRPNGRTKPASKVSRSVLVEAFEKKYSSAKSLEVIELNSESEEEEVFDVPTDRKQVEIIRPPHTRSFSSMPYFEDGLEYEVAPENEELQDLDPGSWPVPRTTGKKQNQKARKQGRNPNEAVLQHRTQSLATPWMYTLAKPFYPNKVDEVESYPFARGPSTLPDLKEYLKAVRDASWTVETSVIRLENAIWNDAKLGRTGYASVNVDETTYYPGDCVIVRGTGSPQKPSKQRKRGLDTQVDDEDIWYASIKYIFEDEYGDKKIHVRWFSHGASTAIGELAGTRELFLLTLCDDIDICIWKKIHVTLVERGPDDYETISEEAFLDDQYFYFLHYNPDSDQFSWAKDHEEKIDTAGHQDCDCCSLKSATEDFDKVVPLGAVQEPRSGTETTLTSFLCRGNKYTIHDFVYIYDGKHHSDPTKPLRIGQILGISDRSNQYKRTGPLEGKSVHLRVCLLERYDHFHATWFEEVNKGDSHAVRDNRRLYFSGVDTHVTADRLSGRCFVKHRQDIDDLESYKDKPDHFWVKNKVPDEVNPRHGVQKADLTSLAVTEIKYSAQSLEEMESLEVRVEDFLKHSKKLATLDLFSGGGGLTAAAELSRVLESRHAVEFSQAAIDHLKLNFPDCQIHNADASVLLGRIVRIEAGEVLEPLVYNGRTVPDLPRRGQVDVICGGPPCPGYTKMNRHPQAEDIKNSLVVVFLSYIDFYRPKYVLMENVKDLFFHRLGAIESSTGKLEGGIDGGTVILILRALTSIGYQVQYALLNAAEYEVPQSRIRVFFWAALPGYPLPSFPQPTTLYKPRFCKLKEMNWYRKRGSAPHKLCTVGDTVTDLPRFEWIDPLMVDDLDKIKDREQRFSSIDQREIIQGGDFVGKLKQSYACSPISEYQRKMRKGLTMDELRNHITPCYKSEVARLVCNIPMEPGADHRSATLPDELKPRYLVSETTAGNRFYPGRYGRLDMEHLFDVCITSMTPTGKSGKVVHPFLHRVISLLEFKRAQSFPDSYKVDLKNYRLKDAIRIFGNAVPVNLGAAILGELLMPLMLKYEREKKNKADRTPLGISPKAVSPIMSDKKKNAIELKVSPEAVTPIELEKKESMAASDFKGSRIDAHQRGMGASSETAICLD